MEPYDSLSEYINDILAELRFDDRPASLYAPILYTLESGGKRLRPTLTLASCQAVGTDYKAALNQAIGIELFHNFTLLHDDVMDRSDVRRGRLTVHRRFGEAGAILSGDAMLTLAGMYAADNADAALSAGLTRVFNEMAMDIYRGQQYDMDFEHRSDVSTDEYIDMIRLKTSVLLGAACRLGAMVGGADADTADALYAFGEDLGLAFQLEDDLLDTYGDPAVFGKEIGGDILAGKKTWLLITARDEAPEALKEALAQPHREDKVQAVKTVYDSLNLPQRCSDLIAHYTSQAVANLERANILPGARQYFTQLARKTAKRER